MLEPEMTGVSDGVGSSPEDSRKQFCFTLRRKPRPTHTAFGLASSIIGVSPFSFTGFQSFLRLGLIHLDSSPSLSPASPP